MARIDFETKSDRELLVLVAQQGNETVDHLAKLNDRILKHERRITALESGGCGVSRKDWKARLKDNWQTLSLLVSVLALIIIEIIQRMNVSI